MKTDTLIEQMELYSNAIVAFVVAQSLAFSFTFGTEPDFSCIVITERPLTLGLLVHFIGSTVLAIVAITHLARSIQRLSSQNEALVRVLFLGKCAVVFVFAVIPVAVLLWFGLLAGDRVARCSATAKHGGGSPYTAATTPER